MKTNYLNFKIISWNDEPLCWDVFSLIRQIHSICLSTCDDFKEPFNFENKYIINP